MFQLKLSLEKVTTPPRGHLKYVCMTIQWSSQYNWSEKESSFCSPLSLFHTRYKLLSSMTVYCNVEAPEREKQTLKKILIHRTQSSSKINTCIKKMYLLPLTTQCTLVPGTCCLRSLLNNSRYWVIVSTPSDCAKSPSGFAANTEGSSGTLGPRKDCMNSFVRFQQSPGMTHGQYSTWGNAQKG